MGATGGLGGVGWGGGPPPPPPRPPLAGGRAGESPGATRPDQVKTFLEQLFEFFDRATLEQHVPVRARRLDLLRLRQITLDQRAFHAVLAQPGAGNLGIVGERHLELFAVLGAVPSNLTRGEVVVAVGFVTYGPQSTASKDTISHRRYSSGSSSWWAPYW